LLYCLTLLHHSPCCTVSPSSSTLLHAVLFHPLLLLFSMLYCFTLFFYSSPCCTVSHSSAMLLHAVPIILTLFCYTSPCCTVSPSSSTLLHAGLFHPLKFLAYFESGCGSGFKLKHLKTPFSK
jgi:hypothetical protein